MKKIEAFIPVLLIIMLWACNKPEPLNNEESKVTRLLVKGYVMTDTLEFLNKGKLIGRAFETDFKMPDNLFVVHDKVVVRRKSDGKTVGEIFIADTAFIQTQKLFYDGNTLSDNLQLTPVANPENMGVRLRFFTPFADFYGGPVDIEFYDLSINFDTFEFIYTTVKVVRDVTATFSEFVELPPISPEHNYVIKVWKAGTKELPYTSMDNVHVDDPDHNHGPFEFAAGTSKLLSIAPSLSGTFVLDGYTIDDFSGPFR